MKEKYKENIQIDEKHMMQTIEITKLMLAKKEAKFEENKFNTWLSLFKIESMKYCFVAILCTIILIIVSLISDVYGYALCILNASIIGTIVLYDSFRSSFSGMEELLKSVKLNSAKIFVYKSNIYLFVNILCTLVLNASISFKMNYDFMTTLLYSLVPTYIISGIVLILVDKIENKYSVMAIYFFCYLIAGFMLFRTHLTIPPMLIIVLLMISFAWYTFSINVHIRCLNSERGKLLWN